MQRLSANIARGELLLLRVMASVLKFVGCGDHPELEGEYLPTDEGRSDLGHEYLTYKQSDAGVDSAAHYCYFWDEGAAEDGLAG